MRPIAIGTFLALPLTAAALGVALNMPRVRSAKLKPPVALPRNTLDMSLRDVLDALRELLGSHASTSPDDWISIRNDTYPWRHILRAAERGDVAVSRVGRKLLMQRSELTKFLSGHRLPPRAKEPESPKPEDEFGSSVAHALRRYGVY